MVRLETGDEAFRYRCEEQFTFQYGQIRNAAAEQVQDVQKSNLHSSMVRLETIAWVVPVIGNATFTFQYGQIRNCFKSKTKTISSKIYIPVWLDQKPFKSVSK